MRAGERREPPSGGTEPIEVDHHGPAGRLGRAERQAEDRSQVVLELARHGAVDRPVPGVVHPGRELVREQPPADLEELDGEDADVVERRRGAWRRSPPPPPAAGPGAGARDTRRMPLTMDVFAHRPEACLAVAAADADDRQLAVERDELLGKLAIRARGSDSSRPGAAPCRRSRGDGSSRAPAAPVASSAPKRAVGMPSEPEQLLLVQPVLPALERRDPGDRADRPRPPRPARSRTRT